MWICKSHVKKSSLHNLSMINSYACFGIFQFLLLIPVEILRWIIILLAGSASACFVALNLRSYMAGSDLSLMVVAAFFLQMALAIFIKVWFFAWSHAVWPAAVSRSKTNVFNLFVGHLIRHSWSGICLEDELSCVWDYSLGCICNLVKSLQSRNGGKNFKKRQQCLWWVVVFFVSVSATPTLAEGRTKSLDFPCFNLV